MEMMIEVQDLSKFYGPVQAVKHIDFQVAAGEIVGFLVSDGAGKTTTLKMLAGFLAPTSGTARINGFDCVSQSLEVRRSLGYLPENVSIYPDMTVSQFLRSPPGPRGWRPKKKPGRYNGLWRSAPEEMEAKPVAARSKGYRQRLGLAQALLNKPPVLILDEPTIGLDPSQIVEIRSLIKNLEGDHTEILSSPSAGGKPVVPPGDHHQPGPYCGQRYPGEPLPADGPRLTYQPDGEGAGGPGHRRCKGSREWAGWIATGEGRYLVEGGNGKDLRPELARLLVQQGFDLLELKSQEFNLEDVFLNLVTEEKS